MGDLRLKATRDATIAVVASRQRPLRDQHYFAVDVASLCQPLGSGGLTQPEFPGDRNREFAASDRLSHQGEPHRIGLYLERFDAKILALGSFLAFRAPSLEHRRALTSGAAFR